MLLAVDTSTRNIGIALYNGKNVISETFWCSPNYHTVELAPAVESMLAKAQVESKDLTAAGVAIGPGSFTGLRIGLALIKGIAFTQQLPVIGVPTLDITTRGVPPTDGKLAAVLQAGRSRLAVGFYQVKDGHWTREGEVENLSLEELIKKIDHPCILTGELSRDIRQSLKDHKFIKPVDPTLAMRSPKYLAELAWERWGAGDVDDVLSLKPYYLHKGDPIPG